jgi:hypothetical protein
MLFRIPSRQRRAELLAAPVELIAEERRRQRRVDEPGRDSRSRRNGAVVEAAVIVLPSLDAMRASRHWAADSIQKLSIWRSKLALLNSGVTYPVDPLRGCLRQRERERRAFHARDLPGAETFEPGHEILVRLRWGAWVALGHVPSTAQRTARLLVLGFELADHSLGLVVEGGEDLVGFSSGW